MLRFLTGDYVVALLLVLVLWLGFLPGFLSAFGGVWVFDQVIERYGVTGIFG